MGCRTVQKSQHTEPLKRRNSRFGASKTTPAHCLCSVHAFSSMLLRYLLQRILSVLLPISIASLAYLYLYPIFHGCAFPVPNPRLSGSVPKSTALVNTLKEHLGYVYDDGGSSRDRHDDTAKRIIPPAPFRFLVLADPQIEGDSSLPRPNDGFTDRLGRHWARVVNATTWDERVLAFTRGARNVVMTDGPRTLDAARKRLDLFGNDYYLAHIYRTLHWWTKPTHVTVLGDLIGSQWVSDAEFKARTGRFWGRVFKKGTRVADEITITGSDKYGAGPEVIERLEASQPNEEPIWSNRIINLAGNHDIGYAGDITEKRIERFEKAFGRHNWDMRFEYPLPTANHSSDNGQRPPSLHLIVLDSLLLDTPALTQSLQDKTYTFLNELISYRSRPVEESNSFTLLLTHLPLHKKAGICTDAPHFSFFAKDDEKPIEGKLRFQKGGLREQNHISDHLSHAGILQGIFGMSGNSNAPANGKGRKGLILTGHDHTGCDVIHFVNRTLDKVESQADEGAPSWSWGARRYQPEADGGQNLPSTPSIREVTLRSMMGEFGGNAGLLSIWFDSDPSVMEWKYDLVNCQMGVQHVWWAVHILTFVSLSIFVVWLILCLVDALYPSSGTGVTAKNNPILRPMTRKPTNVGGLSKDVQHKGR
ncbi:conserved hypothetical protein [Uncinocarpus reesii 1704]|uniref:Calcineurin-like phosphoesterase domain-containing protein n=1 Tax=Uncinocarpus reesii (strain UAMH 1704) TaxID=336963 RepID=C4JJD2_UNCRE|nr:uncharacterized protein UREG_01739 [Uncinocarpus reesii 1704]EEP76890.1 conserved hypothetical protein [Uncinocarpus reesii 1704]